MNKNANYTAGFDAALVDAGLKVANDMGAAPGAQPPGMSDEQLDALLSQMPPEELQQILGGLPQEQMGGAIGGMPENQLEQLLSQLPPEELQALLSNLSAGGDAPGAQATAGNPFAGGAAEEPEDEEVDESAEAAPKKKAPKKDKKDDDKKDKKKEAGLLGSAGELLGNRVLAPAALTAGELAAKGPLQFAASHPLATMGVGAGVGALANNAMQPKQQSPLDMLKGKLQGMLGG